MDLYIGKYWNVVFCNWCQEFPGDCIISSSARRQNLSELTSEEWVELGIIEKELERMLEQTAGVGNVKVFVSIL